MEKPKKNLFSNKEEIKNQLIDVNKAFPIIDLSNATEAAEKIKKINSDVAKGKTTWQELFDTALPKGEKQYAKLGKQMEGQIITTESVIKANQEARASALAHNEALNRQTLGFQATQEAFQALSTMENILAMWLISKGIDRHHYTGTGRLRGRHPDFRKQCKYHHFPDCDNSFTDSIS